KPPEYYRSSAVGGDLFGLPSEPAPHAVPPHVLRFSRGIGLQDGDPGSFLDPSRSDQRRGRSTADPRGMVTPQSLSEDLRRAASEERRVGKESRMRVCVS